MVVVVWAITLGTYKYHFSWRRSPIWMTNGGEEDRVEAEVVSVGVDLHCTRTPALVAGLAAIPLCRYVAQFEARVISLGGIDAHMCLARCFAVPQQRPTHAPPSFVLCAIWNPPTKQAVRADPPGMARGRGRGRAGRKRVGCRGAVDSRRPR